MTPDDRVNILLVDDQPAKLLTYEVILRELGENLIKTASAREAFECLLKNDVAVVLVDVCMPELDGFELAAMIREHPRFQKTAIIFISAIHLTDVDRLRGYEMGAVDYVPVPVVPEVLRAKVRVFAELFRKTRQLEQLNLELERRVADRTAELKSSTARLLQSEQLRSLALAAGQMGSWDWDAVSGEFSWDEGQFGIFGVDSGSFPLTARQRPGPHSSGGLGAVARRLGRRARGRTDLSDRVSRPSSERGAALVHRGCRRQHRRGRAGGRPQRRNRRHHRPQERRGAPDPPGAGGGSSGQECAGGRPIDHPPHPRGIQGRLYRGRGGPHHRSVAGACPVVPVEMAGRQFEPDPGRGAGPLPQERPREDRDDGA